MVIDLLMQCLWCVGGGFNVIDALEERCGGVKVTNHGIEFGCLGEIMHVSAYFLKILET